ncbi:retinol dehydrogenase 13-like isoform X2 [Drosophila obscura]|uniref:retinol dehydrogenase 13-like isoform X2 n=1 Tax=Drosophila obscura TaxID=7282 RepID=UPI001BB202FE|nr:retinol dehydrogenase 13-like isoform X2 [Drosophila obscura]
MSDKPPDIRACFIGLWCLLPQGGQFTRRTDETGKVVIVTGCNTGIGKETVMELARRGATVYMACRDMKKCEQARQEILEKTKNRNIFSRELDLCSLDSVRRFAANFKKENKQLHILINNAGVMDCPKLLTKDGFEMQIGVNHMGHFLLTNLLIDVLRSSAPSRIVILSSLAHRFGSINMVDLNSENSYDRSRAYCQSKLANILFTRELAKRLDGSGVTVNALHPGVVNTELFRNWRLFQTEFGKYLLKPLFWPFVKSPKSGAQTSLYAALDPNLNHITGQYFSDCKPKKVGSAALDDKTAKFLWTESEKWTGLNGSTI